MKKHEIIVDITNNFLTFLPSYYIYNRVAFFTTLSQLRLHMEIVTFGIVKDIIP